MDFDFTADQELFFASAKEYAEKYFTPELIKKYYEEDHHISLEAAMAFRELGFMHLGLPEEVGGIPCDKLTLVALVEKLHESTSVAVTAISEPGAGSDNNAMTCVTVKQPDGTYLLNGQKTWVTLAHLSVYTIVVAKDEDPSYENDKYSLWMVPNGIEGYTYGGLEKIGQQIVPFVDCFFDNVVLTEDMRLGEPGQGWKLLMKKLEFERCLVVAQALGQAQAVMNEVGPYCSERICFQKPIGHLSAIQQHLVEMETILDNVRTRLYKVTTMLDQGKSTRLESALLKAYACKNLTKVAEHALSIYAGIGYTKEMSAGRIWNDLKGYEFAGGTNEIMDYIAGRQLVKKYKTK